MTTNPVEALPDALYQRRLDAAREKKDVLTRDVTDPECWLVNGHKVLMSPTRGYSCDCPWWLNMRRPCRHMALVTHILCPRKASRATINAERAYGACINATRACTECPAMNQQQAIQYLAYMVLELSQALRAVCAADIAYVRYVPVLERIAEDARDIEQTVGND